MRETKEVHMVRCPRGAGLVLALILAWSAPAAALTPMLGYSGRLFDATGQSVDDGAYAITFRLYDQAIGGNLLFEEAFIGTESVAVTDGYFWVLLANNQAGTLTLDEIAALHDQLFLEMEIEGGILEPRQTLAPVPWALAAGMAGGPGGGGPSGDRDTLGSLNCPDGQIPKRVAGVWACAEDETGGGGGADTLASLSCSEGQVAKFVAGAWDCAEDIDTDTDTAGSLVCTNVGDVLKWNGSAWTCGADNTGAGGTVSWLDIGDVPAGLVELPADPATLCNTGELLSWDGTGWICTPPATEIDPTTGTLIADRWCSTDGTVINCTQIAPITTEGDPIFGGSAAAGITPTDLTNWNTAFGWGDHGAVGYLTAENDPVFSGSAAAGITSTQVTNWSTAFGWGNHAAAGYLTAESDPVFSGSAAAGITPSHLTNWNTAFGWGNHSAAGYLTAETDPKIGAITNGNWCRGSGGGVVCDRLPPVTAEVDPKVGSLISGRWCTSNGATITCTATAPQDTSAATICPAGEYLRGDGTCHDIAHHRYTGILKSGEFVALGIPKRTGRSVSIVFGEAIQQHSYTMFIGMAEASNTAIKGFVFSTDEKEQVTISSLRLSTTFKEAQYFAPNGFGQLEGGGESFEVIVRNNHTADIFYVATFGPDDTSSK